MCAQGTYTGTPDFWIQGFGGRSADAEKGAVKEAEL